jgi:hypothetical protein
MTMSEGNGYASRELFLKPAQRRFKDVVLPVTKLKVRIRSLFEGEKEAFEATLRDKNGDVTNEKLKTGGRRLIALCLVDASGERLLSDADAESMGEKDGADMAYLQEECQVFCGFKTGNIEGLVGNSEPAPVAN